MSNGGESARCNINLIISGANKLYPNDLEKLEELLKSGDYDVNEQDVRGRSVLHCLLMKDLFSDLKEIKMGIQMLLKYGADVNIKDKCKEDTPLRPMLSFTTDILQSRISLFLFSK
jgi:ankyrin repeat protein